MTPAETRADAVKLIRQLEGLDNKPPSEWTYEERVKYNKRLADYIAARPNEFAESEVRVAEWVAASPYQPLEDTSFDWGMFGDEVASNAVKISEAGGGVLRRAVYLAVGLGVVFYLAPYVLQKHRELSAK